MEISEITRITNLLKKANCSSLVYVSEVAKEMGVKKTALMQFIVDNPKLFKLSTDKKGLQIFQVFVSAEENPETEEWLDVKKKAWEKKIHIGERTYYGCHEYWLIAEDGNGKERKYRNTPEKVQELADAGVIKKVGMCYGCWGDASHEEVFIFNDEVRKAIEGYGWTTDFDEVSKKEGE